jgi:hypothetical protein
VSYSGLVGYDEWKCREPEQQGESPDDDDDDRSDPGPHAHYDDGAGDCDVCGRTMDQFADLRDEWDIDWDGAAFTEVRS